MNQTWHVTAETGASRWLELPNDLEDPQAWSEDAARGLVGAWGGSKNERDTNAIALLLLEAWGQRDATAVINLLFFPVSAPLVGRVSIAIRRFNGVIEWLDRGYVLDEWSAENLGPGMRCVHIDSGSRPARFIASAFVFRRDDTAVVVSTAPMLPMVYDAMTPDLYRAIETIQVVDPSGNEFLSEEIHEVTVDPLDVWVGE